MGETAQFFVRHLPAQLSVESIAYPGLQEPSHFPAPLELQPVVRAQLASHAANTTHIAH